MVAKWLQEAEFVSVMADECVDCTNNEQLVICFRYVNDNMDVHKEFIGLYQCASITADAIVAVLKDTLLR